MNKELDQHEFIDTTAKWGRDFVEVLNPLKESEILRVYHEPPQRKWVELTKEECFELCVKHKDAPFSLLLAVQDKLKEKNGY